MRDAQLRRCLAIADSAAAAGVFIRRFSAAAGCGPAHGVQPLQGVPLTIKGNIDVAGFVTTAGSRLLANAEPAKEDAPVVARLRALGARLLGHTNMTEFAFSGLGINPHYGTPRNPAFPTVRHIPGGSSAGAAVCVALGIAPVALGTDTGGSVRIPAAFCGVVGFKPTASQIPMAGVLPLSTSLDCVGLLATTVADCRTVFELIRDPGAARQVPRAARLPHTLRLAMVRGYVDDDLDPEVEAALAAFCRRLRDAGVSVSELVIPEVAGIPSMHAKGTLVAVEAYRWHRHYLQRQAHLYDPRVLARIQRGADVSAEHYRDLQHARAAFADAFSARVAPFDAVVWPTTPISAPLLDDLADAAVYDRCNLRVLRNSTIANLADGCAISIPSPDSQVPCGITLAAARGRDAHLLEVATVIEAILGGRRGVGTVCLRDFAPELASEH